MIARSISMEEIMISLPRVKVMSIFSSKETRTIIRSMETRTTRDPRLTMLIRVRRFRRETWMCQRGRMGRIRIAMSTNAL